MKLAKIKINYTLLMSLRAMTIDVTSFNYSNSGVLHDSYKLFISDYNFI